MPLSNVSLLLLFLFCAAASPVDFLLGQEYHGQYVATQSGVLSMSPRKLSTIWMNEQVKSRSFSTDRLIGKCSTASKCYCWIQSMKTGRQSCWTLRGWF